MKRMRILIVSDTHKKHINLEKVLRKEQPLDLMIHAGDAEGCEEYIAGIAGCPLEIVSGNSDFFSQLPREKELTVGGYHILVTHGHYYCVTAGLEDIKKEAYGRGMDVVIFGHTHRPLLDIGRHVTAVNPGSISCPRQEGKQPSYAMMEIDENGKAEFEIRYVDD